ncbi:MAG: transglutaminase domain-containing protein [Candidatus Nanoarchaeia archaeon]
MIEGLTFLEEGKYTPRDENIERVAGVLRRFSGQTDRNIGYYVAGLDFNKSKKEEVFRKRTSSQIIDDGYVTGCTDAELVFISIARELGIPTAYVETLEENWLKNPDPERIQGHIFLDIFIDGRWQAYEPIKGVTINNKYVLKDRNYVEVGKGLDFSGVYIKENGIYRKEPVSIKSEEDIVEIALKMSENRRL